MNAPPQLRLRLSDNHRRSISVSLHLLDKELCQWEQWLEGHLAPGPMYQQQNNLSGKEKTDLRDRITALREVMARLCADLGLAPNKPGTAQLIVGQATILWEMLAELNSSSLRGYGEVPPELARYLDPLGQSLTQQMHAITALFSGPTANRKI